MGALQTVTSEFEQGKIFAKPEKRQKSLREIALGYGIVKIIPTLSLSGPFSIDKMTKVHENLEKKFKKFE